MSAITLRAYGTATEAAKATGGNIAEGTGSAVDVSAAAVMRLSTRVDLNHGTMPQAQLWIETGPSANGPWSVAWELHMMAGAQPGNDGFWQSRPRAVIGDVDAWARLRWRVWGTLAGALSLSLGCDGTGVP